MADQNKKQYIKYEDTTYILEDSRLPDPTGFDNKVLGVDNGAYVIRDEQGGGGGTGTVKSVNNVQPDANGNVNLSASDVHALPDNTAIPTVPQMATDPDMTDWTAGKTVDAAVLATDLEAAGLALSAKYTKPSGGIPASDLADDMPFFTLPEGGEEGQALVSDGNEGAEWGNPPSSGSGLTEEVKQALLDCFENVAWINDQGQTYYDALYAALYPPADVLSISAVFTQGEAVIYDTDSLDTLKQYLVVTATTTDSTTQTVTTYTLSGTLTVGTSTITVSYGGKTTTFTVTVTEKQYQLVEYVETDGASRIDTGVVFDGTKDIEVTMEMSYNGEALVTSPAENVLNGWNAGGAVGVVGVVTGSFWTDGATAAGSSTHLSGIDLMTEVVMTIYAGSGANTVSVFTNANGTKTLTRTHTNVENRTFLPFPLFALSNQDRFTFAKAGLRIKSAVIKVGGITVRNLKACYKQGEIGFVDVDNDVFYGNEGTGTFTKGGDIS